MPVRLRAQVDAKKTEEHEGHCGNVSEIRP
jgi:hypothetical protein